MSTMAESPLTSEDLLRAHLELCDRVQRVLMDENRHLRQTRSLPTPELLAEKEALLPELDHSLHHLRSINAQHARMSAQGQSLMQTAQKRLLKILLLDRENETLLLEASMPHARPAPARGKMPPGHLHRTYGSQFQPKNQLG